MSELDELTIMKCSCFECFKDNERIRGEIHVLFTAKDAEIERLKAWITDNTGFQDWGAIEPPPQSDIKKKENELPEVKAPKIRTLGVYVGLAVDPTVDWDDVCKEASDAGYTSISVFLTTGFFGKMFPWVLVGKKFLYSQLNPDYRTHFRKACNAANAHNITLHLCFVDQFHGSDDVPQPDPYRQQFGDWDEEGLYSSFDGTKCTWLRWSPTVDPKYKKTPAETLAQYTVVGTFGAGMRNFITMIGRVLVQTGAKYSIKWGNETLAEYNPLAGRTTNKRGDRDEVVIWVRSLLRSLGLEPDWYFDYMCTTKGKHKTDPDFVAYDVVRKAFREGIRKKHKAKMELHGILRVKDALAFGFTNDEMRYIKFSTDGDLLMTGDYTELGRSGLPDVDLKMDAKKVNATNVTDFFNSLMPKYDKYVKD